LGFPLATTATCQSQRRPLYSNHERIRGRKSEQLLKCKVKISLHGCIIGVRDDSNTQHAHVFGEQQITST